MGFQRKLWVFGLSSRLCPTLDNVSFVCSSNDVPSVFSIGFRLRRTHVAPAEPPLSFQAGTRRTSDTGRQGSSGRWSLDAGRGNPHHRPGSAAAADRSCPSPAHRVPLRRATVSSIPQVGCSGRIKESKLCIKNDQNWPAVVLCAVHKAKFGRSNGVKTFLQKHWWAALMAHQ